MKYIRRIMNKELRNSTFFVRHSILLVLSIVFCLLPVAGCQQPNQKESLSAQIKKLIQENTELQKQIERSDTENKQFKQQIQVLSGLPKEVKLESLNLLDQIKIGKYTGFFDKDDDGKKEKLIVYIQPVDKQGDTIKAAGDVDVQLWDLNKTDSEALIDEWRVGPEELKKLWFATMLKINYRLTFDVADNIESMEEPLTVKVTFTDYLTGKVLKEQKVIKAP